MFDTATLEYKLDFNKYDGYYVIGCFGTQSPMGSSGIILNNTRETSSVCISESGAFYGNNYNITNSTLKKVYTNGLSKTLIIGVNF